MWPIPRVVENSSVYAVLGGGVFLLPNGPQNAPLMIDFCPLTSSLSVISCINLVVPGPWSWSGRVVASSNRQALSYMPHRLNISLK